MDGGKMHFNGPKNPQGWLPPCCPIGQWWQGQLYITTPPNRRFNQKAPASPLTTRAGGVRSGRAPGQSEGEGAAEDPKKGEGCPAFAIKSSYFPLSG